MTYSWFSKGMLVSTVLLLLSSMVEGGRKRRGFLLPGVTRLPSLSVKVRYESFHSIALVQTEVTQQLTIYYLF